MNFKKTYLLTIIIFVIGLFLGSKGYSSYIKNQKLKVENQKMAQTTILAEGEVKDIVESDSNVVDVKADGYNVLLLGKGGSGHSGGDLADSIILLHIENNAQESGKKAVLISIPRDLWFFGHKLNADPSIRDAVNAITGLYVDNQIIIDFKSFVSVIDKIGGVEIDIPKPYTDNFYPVRGLENELCGFSSEKISELHTNFSGFNLERQFPCRYETIHFDIGKNKLDGETALKYVRSRHGDGDFGRSQRQFFLLKSLTAKNLSLDVLLDLSKMVQTDITNNRIKDLFVFLGNPVDYDVSSVHLSDANVLISGKSKNGAYILLPRAGEGNFSEIKSYIAK